MSLQTVLGRVFGSVRLAMAAMMVAVGAGGGGTAHAQGCDPVEIDKLLAGDGQAEDRFGISVAIDGDTAIIGAYKDHHGDDQEAGSAYVFTRSGSVWTQQAKLTASDGAADDIFGFSVSIEGDTVIIGAPCHPWANPGPGSAYIFTRSGGVWSQQAKLTDSNGMPDDQFGRSVSISGDTVAIGAREDDYHDDNDIYTEAGSAFIFTRSGSVWSQQAKLTASDPGVGDWFGWPVVVDGDTLFVGAGSDNNENGTNAGSVYVFTRSGSVWTELSKLLAEDGATGDFFSARRGISVDGDTAVIGAKGHAETGAAYVYRKCGGAWEQHVKLTPSDGAAGDLFGKSVFIQSDTIVIGAEEHADEEHADNGAAYVYTKTGSAWTQQAKLLASDAATESNFGISVSLHGGTAVIGAYLDDAQGFESGAAYIFDLDCNGCPVDLNADGVVNTQDSIVFLNAWANGDPIADWNDDCTIDSLDTVAYLADWAAGC